ncbi:TIGR02452 family protein [Clostridiaceae bacterium]|jgi:TIGR02452 family protein|nr:TIGR02452 family protein [Lachnospiraceae bacterium]NBH19272.1 TIGR02452 family protein [Clostridiaceae bacterium]
MDRKAVARETMAIMKQGYYVVSGGKKVEIKEELEHSVTASRLIAPKEGQKLLEVYETGYQKEKSGDGKGDSSVKTEWKSRVENLSTVDAIFKLVQEGKKNIGVLNFASAKNPGGGFLNGAMAQEESLAASSILYETLVAHEEYYRVNRANSSMMYTDYGIYSPDVVFFRDGRFALVEEPVKASVLTLPAVNMGQVILKGEDVGQAEQVMFRRMKLALAIFADQGVKNLVLGAYGCGVFRNEPRKVAMWWKELLDGEMGSLFDSVFYAVLDRSRNQKSCIGAFEACFLEN